MMLILFVVIVGMLFFVIFGLWFYGVWIKNVLNLFVFMWYVFVFSIGFNVFWWNFIIVF